MSIKITEHTPRQTRTSGYEPTAIDQAFTEAGASPTLDDRAKRYAFPDPVPDHLRKFVASAEAREVVIDLAKRRGAEHARSVRLHALDADADAFDRFLEQELAKGTEEPIALALAARHLDAIRRERKLSEREAAQRDRLAKTYHVDEIAAAFGMKPAGARVLLSMCGLEPRSRYTARELAAVAPHVLAELE